MNQPEEEMYVGGTHGKQGLCRPLPTGSGCVTLWPREALHAQSVANQGRLSELGCS